MRAKSLILLFVALGCGMIAAVAVSKAVMDDGSGGPAEAMVEIFVAVKDLPHAEKISAENIKLEKWPKTRVPDGALFDLELLENKFTRQQIFAGEPILERKISDSRESFSTSVPSGYRIFDIACNASYIKAGDHVDILGTFRPQGRNVPPESRTVMRNVKVHGINGVSTRDNEQVENSSGPSKGTLFQLLVKESQLEALTLANSMGDLQLNLRPFGEERHEGEDNGQEFLSWINQTQGGKQEKAAEDDTAGFLTQFDSVDSVDSGRTNERREVKPKHRMTILTPTGSKTYEWSDADEIPQEVKEDNSLANEGPNQMLANGYGASYGNVYSGYSGYSPTYPISVGAPPSAAESSDAPLPAEGEDTEIN